MGSATSADANRERLASSALAIGSGADMNYGILNRDADRLSNGAEWASTGSVIGVAADAGIDVVELCGLSGQGRKAQR